jgi:hypothetical protein
MGRLKETIRWLLYVPPIYVTDRPSAAALVEGWRIAYQQQKDKLTVAQKRLEMLDKLADAIIEAGYNPQYGRDIKALLHMTEDELNEDYGE